jgi:outer membrane protein assembly factor BamB
MSNTRTDEPTPRKPLRLWPGVVAAVLLLLFRFALPLVVPEAMVVGLIGSVVGALAIVLWWLFFSRAPWSERLGALVVMFVATFATSRLVHESIAGAGMGMLLYILAIPLMSLALVASAVASRRLSNWPRRASMAAAIVLACGLFTLVRTGGVTSGVIGSDFHWRWTPTPEERLLAQSRDEPPPPPPAAASGAPEAAADKPAEIRKEPTAPEAVDKPKGPPAPPAAPKIEPAAPADTATGLAMSERGVKRVEWPGFRGPERDGVVRGVRIKTDWSASPPVEMWRRPIGPGWSSFAVSGDLLYTQEQRGDEEIVASYKVSTGEPVWRHRDPVRFWESNGGAGPRATPTLGNGRVYTFGATGIVNALDAATGRLLWSRNAASDTGRRIPDWGFASSPLVVDDLVIVAVAGTLVAYDRTTGDQRWTGPSYGGSYSSPHRATIDGVDQVVLLGGPGAISVAPASGSVLWQHAWSPGPIVQPALTDDGDLLINAIASTGGLGTRRLRLRQGTGEWSIEERWTSRGLKPYFNDFVVHKGHAFGFDGNILACIDLEDGARKWKGGRYGNGQLVLLRDQDMLLVLSEDGEMALVGATTDQYKELARLPALNGKTWNHPVLVGDVLLVRNGEEMAAFRLSLEGS